MRKTRQTPKNVKENIMEEEPVIPQALEPVIDTKKMCDDEKHIELNKYNLQVNFLYDCFIFCCNFFYKIIKYIIKMSGVYMLWILIHFGASHLYIKLCVPNTIIGFLISPFMTSTPHCQGLRWIAYNAANVINNMWTILGAWVCSNVFIFMNNNANNNNNDDPGLTG